MPAGIGPPPDSPPPASQWFALPLELLRLCFLKLAEQDNDKPWGVTLAEARQLLASCSPCREWRAVALDTVRPCIRWHV
jgi:hypothetical protein